MNAPFTDLDTLEIPYNQLFTGALAEQIFSGQKSKLPDLSQVCIILPNAQAVQQMRLSLSKHSSQAFIGGFIGNLPQWLKENIPASQQKKCINQATRQLLLIEALKQHPGLFKTENHWQICDSLLELFDELSLSPHQWINESTPVWIEHLKKAYQTDRDIPLLNQEAEIIKTLWQAWQIQLDALQVNDESSVLKQKLLSPVPDKFKSFHFYIIGLDQLSPMEKSWCDQLSNFASVTRVIQKQTKNTELKLLHDIYSQEEVFHQRCNDYTDMEKNFFLNNIKLYDAQSSEMETRAVDLKVRQSLLAGKKNIAVVTENRKIARRLRALLERADINIQDTAGWSLATTSAATILERWLECIEQDFAYQPLLDLLKSPFFCIEKKLDEHLNLVYRFEQDIILHENIANDIERYKAAIKNRHQRLNQKSSTTSEKLIILLNNIQASSVKLLKLFNNQTRATPEIWLKAFIDSIKELGIYKQLTADTAGQRVQEELQKLSQAGSLSCPEMDWTDFRNWLGSTLENEQFKPHDQVSPVKIMNMQQAQYCQFDTLIIAGANRQSLPGSSSQMAFFNQSVRQTLNLRNWHQKKQDSFEQFQQLLFASNDILITWQSEKNGEWMQVSPWVSSLIDFSSAAFNLSLADKELDYILKQTCSVTDRDEQLLSQIQTVTPSSATVFESLIPEIFSASRHQRLIDCPYQFFASDALKLKALDEITLELLKSEYGEKVHRILHAFHRQCPDLPAPFTEQLTENNKEKALTHIKNLSEQVFKSGLEDSIQHRSWLERWLNTAEAYINWQIKRQQEWNIYQLEQESEQKINPDLILKGRLDRVDKQKESCSIIDYKTGNTPRQADIENAENIQLTSYALLMEDVCNVLYLKLDKGQVKPSGQIDGDSLDELKKDVLNRLKTVVNEIRSATPLPAWGDSKTCQYCNMEGLCRKQMWAVTA